MSYTITSAQWANADETAAVVQTTEAGAVLASPERTEVWDAFLAWDAVPGNDPAPFDPFTPEELDEQNREIARQLVQFFKTPEGRAFRALMVLILDQLNVLRERDRDRNDALQAGSTLGAIKTNWAALPALNDISKQTALNAFVDEITGDA